MTFSVTCYMQRGKAKSEMLCRAFANGVLVSGGTAHVVSNGDHLLAGAAVFYGVRPSHKPILDEAMKQGRDWYYIDNAYFDATREKYFRITRNRLQHPGRAASTGQRFAATNIKIEPWRRSGKHVLMCPQSDEFLSLFCPDGSLWTERTLRRLKSLTDREIRIRPWQSDKLEWYRSLPDDLVDCWALVTYSSASAITAMLSGIPAFVTADDCISLPVANVDLAQIETPSYCEDLKPWACVVADNQFTVSEIQSGRAWRVLQNADRSL
jgi:hypothetical protein